jgi:hypothetical protein
MPERGILIPIPTFPLGLSLEPHLLLHGNLDRVGSRASFLSQRIPRHQRALWSDNSISAYWDSLPFSSNLLNVGLRPAAGEWGAWACRPDDAAHSLAKP